ncbi:sigma-54-dependent sensor transcriptional response regulator [Candidatus Magnetoovum chiemensis]|nr:sigma-54-dependent sensor transcriptional response regulator [Candidatus Magnetoovum chiemensis]
MNILLIENNPAAAKDIEQALIAHNITICSDSACALELLKKTAYNVIAIDCANSTQLLTALNNKENVYIIVIAAAEELDDVKRLLSLGANDYLIKPLNLKLLKLKIELIKNQLESRSKEKQQQLNFIEVCTQIERSHNDLLSILNQLRVGSVMVDEDGKIIFLSNAVSNILGVNNNDARGAYWHNLFPFSLDDKSRIETTMSATFEERTKISLSLTIENSRQYWMDIEIHDVPAEFGKKIFFLYDMSEVYDLKHLLDEKYKFYQFIGKSHNMLQVYQTIEEVSKVDWTVLIEGETGTGKELAARAIHYSSKRREHPFIAVNCAGLTDSLLASQLFGHKRGSFTGAMEDHKGFFEASKGGTIFLDEIGDISLNVQTSLLRVLEEKEITRLGDSTSRQIDVRIIAATNKNLAQEVANGSFRQDLLYRLKVMRITLPPLRERKECIPLLVNHFMLQSQAAAGKSVNSISQTAMNVIMEYKWPGNVRELKSTIEYAVIKCRSAIIKLSDLPAEIISGDAVNDVYGDDTEKNEREHLTSAIKKTGGNKSAAAKLLGISRATLYRKLYRIEKQ